MRRFGRWAALAAALAACRELPPEHRVAGGDAERGRAALRAHGCAFCHHVPGVEAAQGIQAPPLTRWAERQYIAGALPNRPDALVLWIMDPQAVEPGTAMPYLGVSEADARDMAAYLYTLGEANPPMPVDSAPAWVY